jgi:predicted nucleic acid-binding protein
VNIALDTNLLAYAEGVNDDGRRTAAIEIIGQLDPERTFIPVQALGELFAVLVKHAGRSRVKARDAVLQWGDSFPLIESSPEALMRALDLAVDHQLNAWDALITASAVEAGCRLLLSEDLQDGFTCGGLTVANPFNRERHPLLVKAFAKHARR